MSGGFFFEHIVEFLLPKQPAQQEADVAKSAAAAAAQSVIKK